MLRNELPAFYRTRIIAPWQEGLLHHQIANRLNVVRSTVSTRREDGYIAQLARRERSVTIPVLRSQFQKTFNRVISTATICRRVLASGLRCRRPLRAPLLTARRLQWARAYQDWLLPQWRNVLFSDESRFGLISGQMTGAYYLKNIIDSIVQPLRNEIGDSSSLWTIMPDPSHQSCSTSLGKRKHCKIGITGNVPWHESYRACVKLCLRSHF
nr:unnamed protein product [Callosobruchus chinensis]